MRKPAVSKELLIANAIGRHTTQLGDLGHQARRAEYPEVQERVERAVTALNEACKILVAKQMQEEEQGPLSLPGPETTYDEDKSTCKAYCGVCKHSSFKDVPSKNARGKVGSPYCALHRHFVCAVSGFCADFQAWEEKDE